MACSVLLVSSILNLKTKKFHFARPTVSTHMYNFVSPFRQVMILDIENKIPWIPGLLYDLENSILPLWLECQEKTRITIRIDIEDWHGNQNSKLPWKVLLSYTVIFSRNFIPQEYPILTRRNQGQEKNMHTEDMPVNYFKLIKIK